MSLRNLCLHLLAILLLSSFVPARGQAVNATLLGTVTDGKGGTLQGAKVTVSEEKTSVFHESVTNESGNYTFPNLEPGTYTLVVQASGFKKETHQSIDLLSNSSTRVDAILSIGSVSESVLVTTAPALLQTDRADISTKLEARQVADLPIGTNRNFQSLLNLVPGTSPAVYQHSQFFNAQSSLQTQANGLPRQGNLYQIEGIDDDEKTGLLQIIIPPAEAIQSVDISTNNFEAELGRATGAVVNVTLKSGTNNVHGSVFEFIQNSAVNARSYFGAALGHLAYNYYGGSIGGPLWKNRLFAFGDYLGTSDHEAASNTFTIPPPAFYTPYTSSVDGRQYIDLSAPLVSPGGKGQVYNPYTGDPLTGKGRTPFVNNQIPLSLVNPISLKILRLLPAPNLNQANIASPTNNYGVNLPFTKESKSFDVKLDYVITQSDHLSGRYSFQRVNTVQAPAFGPFAGGPAAGGFQARGTQNAYSTGLNYDHVFSPTLFTELRFGVAHLRNVAQPSDTGSKDAETLGIPGVNIDSITSGQTSVTIPNFSAPLIGYSASVPWIRAEANIDLVNNWTKVIRNHTLKAGVDLRRVRDDLLQAQTSGVRGAYTFAEAQTSTGDAGAQVNVANDVASFLLDLPSAAGRDAYTNFPGIRQWWFFAFASDKWQISPKLTADLGLRWEFYPPPTPIRAGGFSNYDPATNNLVVAGIGGNPLNQGIKTQYKYFAPRTGLSYRASENLVIRGGFGISFTPYPDNAFSYNFPVRSNNNFNPASTFGPALLADGVTAATFQAGFPAQVNPAIPANGIIPAITPLLVAQQYQSVPLNYKNPYVESWNVAVQQALPGNLSLQLAYVANHGVAISGSQNINLPSTYGGGPASEPEYNCVGCPANLHRTAATNVIYLPFSSNYQSLQAQLTRRFTKNLGLTTAFTWGKGLGYISGDDGGLTFFINRRRNYAPMDFDRRLNYEQSFTYALPVGHNQRWLTSGVGALALGGWKLSGIISVVSGLPFTVLANGSSLNTPGTAQTASLVRPYNVTKGVGTSTTWFDTTAFAQPAGCPVTVPATPCTDANVGLGNTGRNQFRGPGYIQNNVSLFKSFALYREMALETRLDVFQLSNTPQFANPNVGNIAAGNFGQVTTTLGSGQGSVNGVGGGRSLQAAVKFTF